MMRLTPFMVWLPSPMMTRGTTPTESTIYAFCDYAPYRIAIARDSRAADPCCFAAFYSYIVINNLIEQKSLSKS